MKAPKPNAAPQQVDQVDHSIGVILMNLGSPKDATAKEVGLFLNEFLADPRVIQLPRAFWLPLLRAVVVPRRKKEAAKRYQSIFTKQGSPLVVQTQKLAQVLSSELASQMGKKVAVEAAFCYSQATLKEVLQKWSSMELDKLYVLPLYPQYSATTTGAALDQLASYMKQAENLPSIAWVSHYADHPAYIEALHHQIIQHMTTQSLAVEDYHWVLSFHGVPMRYVQKGSIYPVHCQATSAALAQAMGFSREDYTLAYQSKFGPGQWLEPSLLEVLAEKATLGQKVAVMAPGFACECIETLEEIEMEAKNFYLNKLAKAGFESKANSFIYVPCLDGSKEHAIMLARVLRSAFLLC